MDDDITFGSWLRRRRRALDLTQAALAARVGVATVTIEKLEAELRRPSAPTAQRLAEALEITLHERSTFVAWARGEQRNDRLPALSVGQAFADGAARSRPLPAALTRLIGRDAEVAALRALLEQPEVRLVTVTGAGGIGKTRLTLAVVHGLAPAFADGICFVDLAALREPALVAAAIAAALDAPPAPDRSIVEHLGVYLAPRHLLLLLDNFEQVTVAAPLITDLLAAAGRLTVVVTSRVILHLSGEHVFEVPPLALPAPGAERSDAELAASPAVRLFLERARALHVHAVGSATGVVVVSEICRRLDGLPLAIELAAARSSVLSLASLNERLTRRLELLTGGGRDLPARQQTLRATIAWSYDLLDQAEQRMFRWLAVFRGGWTLEAAEALWAGEAGAGSILDLVQALVDAHLVRRAVRADGEPRFDMLDTLHEYAREQLVQHGEQALVGERHARLFVALAEGIAPHLEGGPQQVAGMRRLALESHNMRAALHWAGDGDGRELGLRLATALQRYWDMQGQLEEGRRWVATLLAPADGAPDGSSSEPIGRAIRARALVAAGDLAHTNDDPAAAAVYFEQALALFTALGDPAQRAYVLVQLGQLPIDREASQRQALVEQGLLLYRELGDVEHIVWALGGLGWLAQQQGDVARARMLFDEAVATARGAGDQWQTALALQDVAGLLASEGAHARAAAVYGEGIALCRVVGEHEDQAWMLTGLAYCVRQQGDLARAGTLYREAQALFEALGHRQGIADMLQYQGWVALAADDDAATDLFQRALVRCRETGSRVETAQCLAGLAAAAARQQHPLRAARLFAAVDVQLASRGEQPGLYDPAYHHWFQSARAQLTQAAWEDAWAEGEQMAVAQACVYALGGPQREEAVRPVRPSTRTPAKGPDPAGLTSREVEVLRLVAEGLTDYAVAERLEVSRRTVQAHLQSIYRKLKVPTRTAAARFAVDHHLV